MMKRITHNATIFSQLFMIVAAASFVLHLFFAGGGGNAIQKLLALTPTSVLQQHEFWRLFTFPFSSPHIESFLLFTVVFGFFAPLLESVLSTRVFAASVIGLFTAQAMLYLTAFSGVAQQPLLTGVDSLSFFVMALYTFVIPNRSVRLWKNTEIRGLYLVLALTAASFVYSGWYGIINFNKPDGFFYGSIASAFGVFYAFVITILIHRSIRAVRKREAYYHITTSSEDEKYEEEEELVSTVGSGNTQRQPTVPLYTPKPHLSDEEMLNFLLDKIYEQGQESLTTEERSFLEEYSKRIR